MAARLRWAEAFHRRLAAAEAELCDAVRNDIAKPAWETLTQELMPLVASLRWHRREARRILGPHRVRGAAWWQLGQRHYRFRLPVGRVLIIATWNYPIQLLGVQMAQAIVGGNRVVVKPSERSPRSQRMLVELARAALSEAGLPPDMLVSAEATREAGRALLERERFDHVVFTGSTEVGREIALACARTLTPCTLELSGRDSAIVLEDAEIPLAARAIWHAATMNAGQTCMAPRRALVVESVYAAFVDALRPIAGAAKPVRLTDAAMAERCVRLSRDAVSAGARSVSGVIEPAQGSTMRPLAVADCPRDCELVAGAHFGPVLAVVPVRDLADALALHRSEGQHLATSVYTRHTGRILHDTALLAALGSTTVTLNDTILPTAHPAVSIAGVGASGWGASRGEAGLCALTREVVASTTSLRIRTPLDEPDRGVKGWLRRLALGPARPISSPTHGRPGAASHPTGAAEP
ncbi:MAG: aldehyde dehydrogenase family protein [Phycisphaerales bacterium]